MNKQIKVIRLKNGEDIISEIVENEEKTILINPMSIFFKRMQTGKAIIMMSPWIPIEIVSQDSVEIYNEDILSVMNSRKNIEEYYIEMLEKINEIDEEGNDIEMSSIHDEYEGEEEDEDSLEEESFGVKTKKQLH